jgi:hypothetical protein
VNEKTHCFQFEEEGADDGPNNEVQLLFRKAERGFADPAPVSRTTSKNIVQLMVKLPGCVDENDPKMMGDFFSTFQ